MAGTLFRKAVEKETGYSWDQWVSILNEDCGEAYSYEQLIDYLQEIHTVDAKWLPIIAAMYEQKLGRKPVGQTAAVGFQIGVRRTADVSKEQIWNYMLSPDGLKLWIGVLPSLPLQAGSQYKSEDGTFGRLGVIKPYEKLRMTWQRKDWDKPSALQIYLLTTKTKKTTISFHQEKLDDLYMREVMKLHWEEVLDKIIHQTQKE
ncbi:SRPBCC domain-containing protein [Paenibacillus eucommiae]|uniref:Uncharacterized protein YndB with AHSA1/START domain n=1 Tax=Paenibacillus eucommiae TaxID=1355755 RepID=A0ABS4J3Q1_9BACL|nr:SRPBCC domain-containing protein [Paenibacillus eucommiae]MBP1994462.1 uncharacterized protein YndB with AHSA1/START domain [Paenibacillus eucommiae]